VAVGTGRPPGSPPAAPAGERTFEAALGLHQHRVGGALRVGAALAVARHRAVHQPRVERAQRVGPEPEALHDARAEVLDHHVGLRGELLDDRDGLRVFQVQRQAALAGVELAEIGAVTLSRGVGAQRVPQAHVVALGRLDLDDVGPQVGKQARAVGAGKHDGEVEHAHAGERPGAAGLAGGCRGRRVGVVGWGGPVHAAMLHERTLARCGGRGIRRTPPVPAGDLGPATGRT
jgi:hypothetical protein